MLKPKKFESPDVPYFDSIVQIYPRQSVFVFGSDRQGFILQFEKAKDQEELNKAINSFQQSLRKNINAQNLKRFVKSFMK